MALLCLLSLPCLLDGRLVREAEDGFAECNDFFHQGSPPQGFSEPAYTRICQRSGGEKQFATLYSTEHRIPVYSAFIYREGAASQDGDWMLEPQLDDSKSSLDEAAKGSEEIEGLGTNQALEEDYASSDYQPGPLFHRAPAMLTNAVPLPQNFKEKWATDVDQLIAEKLAPHCGNDGNLHILAGAVPSSNKLKDKVSIPESVWLAACCSVPEPWSLGVIKTIGDVDGLEQVTLEELESRLPGGVKLFANQCGGGAVHPDQRTSESATQTEEEEPPAAPGAFSRFFQLLFCIIYEVVKNILWLVWFLVRQVLNLVLGRLCWIWTAITTYVFALSKVLLNIPCDIVRVLVNIICGFVRILNIVFSAVCLLLKLPARFLFDMASFPYYTICAIPDVGIDILSGIWGVVALGLNAVFGAFGGSFSVASFAGNSFFSKLTGQSEGYEN